MRIRMLIIAACLMLAGCVTSTHYSRTDAYQIKASIHCPDGITYEVWNYTEKRRITVLWPEGGETVVEPGETITHLSPGRPNLIFPDVEGYDNPGWNTEFCDA